MPNRTIFEALIANLDGEALVARKRALLEKSSSFFTIPKGQQHHDILKAMAMVEDQGGLRVFLNTKSSSDKWPQINMQPVNFSMQWMSRENADSGTWIRYQCRC